MELQRGSRRLHAKTGATYASACTEWQTAQGSPDLKWDGNRHEPFWLTSPIAKE